MKILSSTVRSPQEEGRVSLNIMSLRENGFRGFGSQPGSILRLEGANMR